MSEAFSREEIYHQIITNHELIDSLFHILQRYIITQSGRYILTLNKVVYQQIFVALERFANSLMNRYLARKWARDFKLIDEIVKHTIAVKKGIKRSLIIVRRDPDYMFEAFTEQIDLSLIADWLKENAKEVDNIVIIDIDTQLALKLADKISTLQHTYDCIFPITKKYFIKLMNFVTKRYLSTEYKQQGKRLTIRFTLHGYRDTDFIMTYAPRVHHNIKVAPKIEEYMCTYCGISLDPDSEETVGTPFSNEYFYVCPNCYAKYHYACVENGYVTHCVNILGNNRVCNTPASQFIRRKWTRVSKHKRK